MIGVDSPEADAELIAVAANLFKDLGLKPEQVKIRLNDRQLMYQKLQEIGVEVTRTADVLHLIDRRDKLSSEAWVQYALEQGFLNTIISRLEALLNNYDLWKDSPRLVRCMQALERIGVREFIQYDPKVIRGLDYYTGVVFEAFDVDGGRAILGGGHYGNLVADVGGDSLPGVGFAMGDVMFPIVLEKYGLLPTQIPAPAEVLVTVFDEETLLESIELAESLRGSGLRVICYPESVKLPKQLKFADKLGIRLAVILGPDEVKTGKAVLKDMKTTEQVSVAIAELDQEIHRLLA